MKLHTEIVNTKQKYYSLFSKDKRHKMDLNHNDNRIKMYTDCKSLTFIYLLRIVRLIQ